MSPVGRPAVGAPINVRLGDDLIADLDTYAARIDISRAEVIRRAVKEFLWDDENEAHGQ